MRSCQRARRVASTFGDIAAPARFALALAGLLVVGGGAHAQQPASPGMDPKAVEASRFPQPVLVGGLIGRKVLRPTESQDVIGKVDGLVRRADGSVDVVVDFGGRFGFGARPIGVPIKAMVLLGDVMEVVDFTPAQLQTFPTFTGGGTTPVSPDEMIKVGLARPSH